MVTKGNGGEGRNGVEQQAVVEGDARVAMVAMVNGKW